MFEEGRYARHDGSRRSELTIMQDRSARFDVLAGVTSEDSEDGHRQQVGWDIFR